MELIDDGLGTAGQGRAGGVAALEYEAGTVGTGRGQPLAHVLLLLLLLAVVGLLVAHADAAAPVAAGAVDARQTDHQFAGPARGGWWVLISTKSFLLGDRGCGTRGGSVVGDDGGISVRGPGLRGQGDLGQSPFAEGHVHGGQSLDVLLQLLGLFLGDLGTDRLEVRGQRGC